MGDIYTETAPKAVHASMKKVIERIEFHIKYETDKVKEWLQNIQKVDAQDPSNPYGMMFDKFRWSDKTMASVARLHVYGCVMNNAGLEKEKVTACVKKNLLDNAACPSFSTSYCSNYMHILEGAAWASVLELLESNL